jgi:hypothetical protein
VQNLLYESQAPRFLLLLQATNALRRADEHLDDQEQQRKTIAADAEKVASIIAMLQKTASIHREMSNLAARFRPGTCNSNPSFSLTLFSPPLCFCMLMVNSGG